MALLAVRSGNEVIDAIRQLGLVGDRQPQRFPTTRHDFQCIDQVILASTMTNVQTTISLVGAYPSRWPTASAFRILVDQEYMLVTGGWGTTTLTVTRGFTAPYGTTQAAAAHTAGAVIHNYSNSLDGIAVKAVSLGGKVSDQVLIGDTPAFPHGPDTRSIKCTVHPGDYDNAADTTRERCELVRTTQGEVGEEWFYHMSYYLPAAFTALNNGGTILQIGPNHGQGSPAFYMRTNNTGIIRINFNSGVLDTNYIGTHTTTYNIDGITTSTVDQWIEFVIGVYAHISAGTFKLWYRLKGDTSIPWTKAIDLSGIPTSNSKDGVTPSVQVRRGYYRSGADVVANTNSVYVGPYSRASSFEDAISDPVTPNKSSYACGIWPSTTNLVTPVNSFEAAGNLTGWSSGAPATRTQVDGNAAFGVKSLQIDITGQNGQVYDLNSGILTIGQVYTDTIWITRDEVDFGILKLQVRNEASSATIIETNLPRMKGPFPISLTFTATETGLRTRFINQDAAQFPIRFWVDGHQIEQKNIATPFTDSTRGASRVYLPKGLTTPNQGFVIIRFMSGWDFSQLPYGGAGFITLARLGNSTDRIKLFYRESAQQWVVEKIVTAGGSAEIQRNHKIRIGQRATVAFIWTPTQVGISLNADTISYAASVGIPTITGSNLDIGSNLGASEWCCGNIFWAVIGVGVPSQADLVIADSYRDEPPPVEAFSSAAAVTAVMQGKVAQLNTPDYALLDNVVWSEDL